MTPDDRTDAYLLMQAALDGELDAAGMLAFERRLAADPDLGAEYERLMALRAALRDHSTAQRAPDDLRRRIAALAEPPAAPAPEAIPGFGRRWRALATAAALAGIAAGIAGTMLVSSTPPRETMQLASLLVDDHRRALLAREPVDVVTSDRHTVKPWFDGRIALSPPVIDLANAGFTLVGARAAVVMGTPVPTLVYRLREHLISLTALPATRFAADAQPPAIEGYEIVTWSDANFTYWAIADLPRSDIETFATTFRARAREDAPPP